jgi:hypothetical protein
MAAGNSGFIVKDTPATKTADYTLNHGWPRLATAGHGWRSTHGRAGSSKSGWSTPDPGPPTPANA